MSSGGQPQGSGLLLTLSPRFGALPRLLGKSRGPIAQAVLKKKGGHVEPVPQEEIVALLRQTARWWRRVSSDVLGDGDRFFLKCILTNAPGMRIVR